MEPNTSRRNKEDNQAIVGVGSPGSPTEAFEDKTYLAALAGLQGVSVVSLDSGTTVDFYVGGATASERVAYIDETKLFTIALDLNGRTVDDILTSSDGASSSNTALVTAGYLDANYTSATGLGTMATQDADSVAITGGTAITLSRVFTRYTAGPDVDINLESRLSVTATDATKTDWVATFGNNYTGVSGQFGVQIGLQNDDILVNNILINSLSLSNPNWYRLDQGADAAGVSIHGDALRIESTAATFSVPVRLNNTAVAETPTATHTVTIEDDQGTTYRLLAVV